MNRFCPVTPTQLPSCSCADTPCRTKWIRAVMAEKNTFPPPHSEHVCMIPSMKKSVAAMTLCAAAGCVTRTSTTSTIQPGGTLIVADAGLYAKARAIHERVFTIDTHVDIPAQWSTTPQNDADSGTAQVTFRKMKQGGLDGAFFAVYVGQGPRTPAGDSSARVAAMQKFNGIHRSVD